MFDHGAGTGQALLNIDVLLENRHQMRRSNADPSKPAKLNMIPQRTLSLIL